jgi:para-nitrobenzyl esterase
MHEVDEAFGAGAFAEASTGKLRGRRSEGVCAFLGVPYGAATKRFLPPEPAAPWTGVRDATAFGPRAPQPAAPKLPPPIEKLWRFAGGPTSEDCLALNVWTPAVDGRKRPVMFWCHGGGFASGSGQEPDYEGSNLARRQDVVVVTVNHRLNVFGFGYVAHLGGAEFADSGQVGMLDLLLALRWVQANIAGFGGDPDNITIFGQSGGAGKIAVLLNMPAARGLFHKAILMSLPREPMPDLAHAEEAADRLMKELGLGKGDFDQLRSMPAEALVKVGGRVAMLGDVSGLFFRPVIDQRWLFRQPFELEAPDCSADIPIVIGHTRDEMSTLMMGEVLQGVSEAALPAAVAGWVGEERAAAIIAAYRDHYPDLTPASLLIDIVSDQYMGAGATQLADLKAAQGQAAVFRYLVTWPVPLLGGAMGAAHGEDMPLVFDNVEVAREGLLGPGPAPQLMADMMSGAFAAFARTGSPQHPTLPSWPPYETQRRQTLIFDVPPGNAADPQSMQREIWR